jgi:hypothetical protein
MTSSWLLITAGFGGSEMEGAALRVKAQAKSLGFLDQVTAITTDDLATACPLVWAEYSDFLNTSHKGYGYFSWKVELVYGALHGYFGDFDGVIWVDAGCEIFNTPWTRMRLKHWMKKTQKTGTFLYTLDTPEQDFSKALAFEEFPSLDPNDRSPQIQATWFMLYGKVGRQITKKWLDVSLKNIALLDLSPSPRGEVRTFVEHRFDQSILSLLIKALKLQPDNYFPCSGNSGLKSQLRGLVHPIWTTRNRHTKSLIKFPNHNC